VDRQARPPLRQLRQLLPRLLLRGCGGGGGGGGGEGRPLLV
jgi:hypothetical protein